MSTNESAYLRFIPRKAKGLRGSFEQSFSKAVEKRSLIFRCCLQFNPAGDPQSGRLNAYKRVLS